MRKSILLVALGLLLASSGLALPASADAATRCTAKGATTVVRNSTARVFYVRGRGEVKRTYYGCELTKKPILLTRDVSPKSEEDTHTRNTQFALAGRYVGWHEASFSDFGAGEFYSQVKVVGLRPGDRHYDVPTLDVGGIRALVVRSDGASAWIAESRITTTAGTTRVREVDAVSATSDKAAPLDSGPGIRVKKFSIDARGVHWTNNGRRQTAKPYAPPAAPALDPETPGPQALDPAYGNSGCGTLDPAPGVRHSQADAIARGADGTYAIVGRDLSNDITSPEPSAIIVEKLTSTGAPDPAWNNGAAVVVKLPQPTGVNRPDVGGVAIQPDGRVVVAGYFGPNIFGGSNDSQRRVPVLLARFNRDGTLDQTFGSGGVRTDAFAGTRAAVVHDIAIQPDGSIVTAGHTNNARLLNGELNHGKNRFTVARFKPDGTLDSKFAGDGLAVLDTPASPSPVARAVRVVPDGRILAAGGTGTGFALARFLPDGRPDKTFGTKGVTFDSPPARGGIRGFDVLPDGRIVAVGDAWGILSGQALALARYSPDGKPDKSFGTSGAVIDQYGGSPTGIVARGDGTLVVSAARLLDGRLDGGLSGYRADGSRDPGFGVGGSLASAANNDLDPSGIVPGPNGSILAALSDRFAVASFAIDTPPAGDRVCSLAVTTQSLTQMLAPDFTGPSNGRLRVNVGVVQPGSVMLTAEATVNGKSVSLGSVPAAFTTFGVHPAQFNLSPEAADALRDAQSVVVSVTAGSVTVRNTLPR